MGKTGQMPFLLFYDAEGDTFHGTDKTGYGHREREKADAQGHDDRCLWNSDVKDRQQGIQIADQEVGVFEYHQKPEVVDQTADQIALCLLRMPCVRTADEPGKSIVDDQGQQQEQGIPAAADGVENKAADDECDVSVFLRCSIVCQQENRQKLKQEFNCAENHI